MIFNRNFLGATILLLGCLLQVTAYAQDPQSSAVQLAARQWLELADKLDADTTWRAGGPRFQQAITVADWEKGLKQEREPRGAIVRRTMIGTSYGTTFRGVPDAGHFALVRFRTSFANKEGEEHVTLERGSDGVWRVVGYLIL